MGGVDEQEQEAAQLPAPVALPRRVRIRRYKTRTCSGETARLGLASGRDA